MKTDIRGKATVCQYFFIFATFRLNHMDNFMPKGKTYINNDLFKTGNNSKTVFR